MNVDVYLINMAASNKFTSWSNSSTKSENSKKRVCKTLIFYLILKTEPNRGADDIVINGGIQIRLFIIHSFNKYKINIRTKINKINSLCGSAMPCTGAQK